MSGGFRLSICIAIPSRILYWTKFTGLSRKGRIMQTFNIHEAKTQLSRLVELAARGEPFVIAKAGKPMVKVIALNAPAPAQMQRLGFMAGQIEVPDDFNTMGADDIEALFAGNT